MINLYVQHLMIMAFSVFPTYKAENFCKHMDPILYQVSLTKWKVDYWADLFDENKDYKDFNKQIIVDTEEVIEND